MIHLDPTVLLRWLHWWPGYLIYGYWESREEWLEPGRTADEQKVSERHRNAETEGRYESGSLARNSMLYYTILYWTILDYTILDYIRLY